MFYIPGKQDPENEVVYNLDRSYILNLRSLYYTVKKMILQSNGGKWSIKVKFVQIFRFWEAYKVPSKLNKQTENFNQFWKTGEGGVNKNPSTTFQVLALVGPTDDMYTHRPKVHVCHFFTLYFMENKPNIKKKPVSIC